MSAARGHRVEIPAARSADRSCPAQAATTASCRSRTADGALVGRGDVDEQSGTVHSSGGEHAAAGGLGEVDGEA